MNKIMFVGGLCIAVTLALLFVLVDTKELVGSLTVLGIIGILLIGASKFRSFQVPHNEDVNSTLFIGIISITSGISGNNRHCHPYRLLF